MGKKAEFSVENASIVMRKDAQLIRYGLQQKIFPFGNAIQKPDGRWSYYIVFRAFCEYMHYTEEEVLEILKEAENKKGVKKDENKK